uniref:Uncharacterized protein n=1 Tax=Arundo donax TaxID=35708 RepID=A0A0A8ZDB4_ARUDO
MKKDRYAERVEKDHEADHFHRNTSRSPGRKDTPSSNSQSERYSRRTCTVKPPLIS